jgi:transposase-like protein
MANETTIAPELLDQLLANYAKPENLLGEEGLFKQLKKALIERALGAELTEHLGYEKGDPARRGAPSPAKPLRPFHHARHTDAQSRGHHADALTRSKPRHRPVS